MIESDHHPSLHVDFGKLQPKLASYVNYLFAQCSSNGQSCAIVCPNLTFIYDVIREQHRYCIHAIFSNSSAELILGLD